MYWILCEASQHVVDVFVDAHIEDADCLMGKEVFKGGREGWKTVCLFVCFPLRSDSVIIMAIH